MTERDKAYLAILCFGLQRIRDAAEQGYTAYCAVEADHLHNIPSLIGEKNEHRHTYYIEKEKELYLERVDRSVPGVQFALDRYSELWPILEQTRARGEHA